MNANHFDIVDSAFCDYYKKVLGLHRSMRNRHVILMCGLPLLTEKLVSDGKVPCTRAYQDYIEAKLDKLCDVDPEFFLTPAMCQKDWKKSCAEKRHLITRFSCHGFHHKLCSKLTRHDRSYDCICKFCKRDCSSLFHGLNCDKLLEKSISFLDSL